MNEFEASFSGMEVGRGDCQAHVEAIKLSHANSSVIYYSLEARNLSCERDEEASCALRGLVGVTLNCSMYYSKSVVDRTLPDIFQSVKEEIQKELGCPLTETE